MNFIKTLALIALVTVAAGLGACAHKSSPPTTTSAPQSTMGLSK